MTVTLPPELAGLLEQAGGHWPEADEHHGESIDACGESNAMNSTADTNELKEILKQELLDQVTDVGPLGVYELVWSLRGQENTLTDAERVALAKQVARGVLGSGTVVLCRLRWPSNDPISSSLTFDDVTEADWLDIPPSGEYPAFVSRED
ncbi:MAG: hypothetical protein ACRDT0_24210 [Pseudonocardiaceae bacterium]